MRTPKLISNYSFMSEIELASLATRTIDALRTNANFPTLNPTFAEFEPVALDYLTKQGITASGRASTQQSREKDEAREALLVMMRRVVSYINNFTTVSSLQLSSGFQPVPDPSSLRSPRPSAWTRLRDSNRPGEILLEFEAVREAYEYELAIASALDTDGQPLWQNLGTVSSSRGNFYAPVVDGTMYYFRVRSRNKRGVSAWSPISSLRARVGN